MIDLSAFSIYPYCDTQNNLLHDGQHYKLPSKCQQCKARNCLEIKNSEEKISYCDEGYGYYHMTNNGFIILGLVTENSKINVLRYYKSKVNFITSEHNVHKWINTLNSINTDINKIVETQVKNIASSVHDIKAMSSAIYRTIEDECEAQNVNFNNDEELQKAKPHLFRLSKLAKVWTERIEIMEILSDPAKASIGKKREQRIYAFVDKYIKLLQPMADIKGCHINKNGNSFSTKEVYDSFGTIPFILIDNAIKYSYRAKPIEIDFMELPTGSIIITITTFSPIITTQEISNIFERNVRGQNALKMGIRGSGLGLYLAKVVADANNIKLTCEVSQIGTTTLDNVQYGFVKFKIEL